MVEAADSRRRRNNGFFRDIPFNDRKSRDDDYNLQRQSNIEFLHIPSCQIIRSWNQNHLCLKSEADVTALKEDFIQKKLNSYDEECFKPNCQLFSFSMPPRVCWAGLQYVQARPWLIQRTPMPQQTSHVYSYMCPSSGLSWDGLRPWVLLSISNQNCSSLTQLCIYDF